MNARAAGFAPFPASVVAVAGALTWQWRVQTDDMDAHAKAQPDWDLRYDQLSEGRFEGLVHHIQLPYLRLVREHCSVAVRQRGRFDDGKYGFAMALHAPEPAIFNGQRVDADSVMLGRNRDLDLCTPAGYDLMAVVVHEELLVPLWQSLYGRPPSEWLESQLVVPARTVPAQALRSMHLKAMDDAAALLARQQALPAAEQEPNTAALQLRDALLMEWLEALPESVDASALPSALARKKLVDQACELLLSRPDEPLSMLEICRQVGTSRRKLNYCFQEVLGVSPIKYLRAVRLNGVRRELRLGRQSVQDAAARWGFWHMGQFSKDYKQQFGELPSRTLNGARGDPHGKP